MKKSLLINAFFSVTLFAVLTCPFGDAYAQDITQKLTNAATHAVVSQIAPPQTQVLAQASISIVAPVGGETYVAGNRYPISWHANIPQVNAPYTLTGEIRLIDQNAASKKDLRIAFLNAQELAKGTYEFRAGAQTEMAYGHVSPAQGQYKVWIYIKGFPKCGPNEKCGPLFEATATSASPVTIKH